MVIVMAEGSETPDERSRPSERDLLAERRARRAVDLDPVSPAPSHPTDALTRRAEAAEATVQTLETHLANLRQQVREATEERAILAERLAAEQAVVAEGEHELRRVKQREYAEQQLRVESEDRRVHAERDSRTEIDRLTRRLDASEHHARELTERLESVQRELDEAEQVTAAERAVVRRGERELQLRLTELEQRALEIRREIDSERRLRERAEGQLAEMRAGYRRIELLVVELKGCMVQLRAAAAREPKREAVSGVPGDRSEIGQREELADALAAAVERLRARADASALEPEGALQPEDFAQTPITGRPSEPGQLVALPEVGRSPHKHSMSLLTRIKRRRKQRRERRSAAAEPPNIKPQ
jgi:chromosome segregation ATPase